MNKFFSTIAMQCNVQFKKKRQEKKLIYKQYLFCARVRKVGTLRILYVWVCLISFHHYCGCRGRANSNTILNLILSHILMNRILISVLQNVLQSSRRKIVCVTQAQRVIVILESTPQLSLSRTSQRLKSYSKYKIIFFIRNRNSKSGCI